MSKGKSLIKNTIIFGIGNLGAKLLTFLMLPFYTIYLTTSEFGAFDVIVTAVSLILPIITFQITDGIYRNIVVTNDIKTRKIAITNGALVMIKNFIIFTAIYVLIAMLCKMEYTLLIYVYILTTILYTSYGQVARGLKHNKEFAIAGMLSTAMTVIMNIILISSLNMKIDGLILAFSIGNIIGAVYLGRKSKILSYISFDLKDEEEKAKLKKYSIPLIPNVISWWVMNASDRFMIKHFIGNSFNGLYAASNKFSSIIVIINSFFSLAWQESAITEYGSKERDEYYTSMFNAYMKFQMTTAIVLIAGTKIVFDIFIHKDFREGYVIVPIMYMASVFSAFSVFYGTGYQSANDTKGSFYTTIIGAILNFVINIFAIPTIGIMGAAISTLISYIVVWLLRVKQTKKYFSINIDKKNFSVLLILMSCFVCAYYIDSKVFEYVLLLLSLIVFIIFNKDLVQKVIKMIQKKLMVKF